MPYITGIASGHYDLFEKIRNYVKGVGTNATPSYTGTGNGTITSVSCGISTVTETITLTCTATATNGGTFSVVGSVSGAHGSATVGTPYTSNYINFTINDGSIDFILGDAFTIVTTIGAMKAINQQWEELEYSNAANRLFWARAPGISGSENIYLGMRTYQDTPNDYYNLSVFASSGWVSGNPYTGQPNFSGAYGVPMWSSNIEYVIVANGQRVFVNAKIESRFVSFYLGKMLPIGATPNQYPYPVMVGGMLTSEATTRYSDTAYVSWWKGVRSNCRMFFNDGVWKQPYIWLYSEQPSAMEALRSTASTNSNPVGIYGLYPAIVYDTANIYGVLDGLYYISGYNQAAENITTIEGTQYIIFNDSYRTTALDYIAVRLS